jgi:hypothetical protein
MIDFMGVFYNGPKPFLFSSLSGIEIKQYSVVKLINMAKCDVSVIETFGKT